MFLDGAMQGVSCEVIPVKESVAEELELIARQCIADPGNLLRVFSQTRVIEHPDSVRELIVYIPILVPHCLPFQAALSVRFNSQGAEEPPPSAVFYAVGLLKGSERDNSQFLAQVKDLAVTMAGLVVQPLILALETRINPEKLAVQSGTLNDLSPTPYVGSKVTDPLDVPWEDISLTDQSEFLLALYGSDVPDVVVETVRILDLLRDQYGARINREVCSLLSLRQLPPEFVECWYREGMADGFIPFAQKGYVEIFLEGKWKKHSRH